MMGFSVLFRKELHELLRTGRAAVTLILYLLIGLGSPLVAKGLPWLFSHIPEDQLGGMDLIITQDPTLADAMAQYLKNLGLIPLLVVLLGMGAVNGERRSGLLSVILSRPVSRRAVLAAKALSTALLHVTGTVIAAAGCALYSQILFGGLWMPGFLAMNGVILLLNLLFAALTLLASVLTPSPGPQRPWASAASRSCPRWRRSRASADGPRRPSRSWRETLPLAACPCSPSSAWASPSGCSSACSSPQIGSSRGRSWDEPAQAGLERAPAWRLRPGILPRGALRGAGEREKHRDDRGFPLTRRPQGDRAP